MVTRTSKQSPREQRRLQTRERILGAAIAEFKRAGMAGADVNSIVTAAGVAHGTFFFHFPSKGHVLLELEIREESRMAVEFTRFLSEEHELAATLAEVVDLVVGLEDRFGPILFKEVLALHFSPSRPTPDEWTGHPLIVLVVREIESARRRGAVRSDLDPFYNAAFFLYGIYGVLTTIGSSSVRDAMLAELVTTFGRNLHFR